MVVSGFISPPGQGGAVSFSADGTTLAVGGPFDNATVGSIGIGATWVFTRLGTQWVRQAKLVGDDYTDPYPASRKCRVSFG